MSEISEKNTPFDKLVYVSSFGYPLTALPQIIQIYATHSAHDLSLASWVMYVFFEAILVAYGIKRHLIPIVIQGVLWLVAFVIIIVGILLYR